jgi:hypothetical protein
VAHKIINVIQKEHISSNKERWKRIIGKSDLNILEDNMLAVVTKLVKEIYEQLSFQVGNSIKPFHVVIKGMVNNPQIPIDVANPDDMWQCLPFLIVVISICSLLTPTEVHLLEGGEGQVTKDAR